MKTTLDIDMRIAKPIIIQDAIEFILQKEGFISSHKDDRGGFTIFGISSKFHPDNPIFTQYPLVKDLPKDFQKHALYPIAVQFYQKLAEDVYVPYVNFKMHFAFIVNAGERTANKALQRSVDVKDDGIIGVKTISSLEGYSDMKHLSEIVKSYAKIACKGNNKVFINGWINRAFDSAK